MKENSNQDACTTLRFLTSLFNCSFCDRSPLLFFLVILVIIYACEVLAMALLDRISFFPRTAGIIIGALIFTVVIAPLIYYSMVRPLMAKNLSCRQSRDEVDKLNISLSEEICKLHTSEERYKTLLETIPDVVYKVDVHGRFTFVNDAVCQVLGYTPEELIGKHFSTIIAEEEVEEISREIVLPAKYAGMVTGQEKAPKLFDERRTGKRSTSGLEVHLVKKAPAAHRLDKSMADRIVGEINCAGIFEMDCMSMRKEFSGTIGIIKTSGAKLTGSAGVIRDITNHRQALNQLLTSEKLFEAITLGISDGMFLMSGDYKVIWSNRAAVKITGYSLDEIIGKYCYQVCHAIESPCRAPLGPCPLTEAKDTGKPVTAFHTHYDREGNRKFVEITIYPLKHQDGEPDVYVHVSKDITEQKHREMQYKAIIHTSMDGFLIFDVQGAILDVNEAQCKLLGYGKEELTGMRLKDIAMNQGPGHGEEKIQEVKRNGSARFEDLLACKDGTAVDVDVSVHYLEDGVGGKFFAFYRDMTRRKSMERELHAFTVDLEMKIQEETQRRRQQEQLLIQQSKMAAMGEIMGVIAHQWKQPINAVSIIIQDIKDAFELGVLDKEYIDKTVKDTMEQIMFMTHTMDDFRKFLTPSRKKSLFDVKKAIEEIITMFASLFKKDAIVISLEKDDSTQQYLATGYPNECKQVILNLINNSRDAILASFETMPDRDRHEGRIHIRVTREAANTDREKVIVTIKDNGGGIPEQVMERIFEPYFTTKAEGSGIGLYMSKTIVENNMAGKLMVRNIEDGAEFRIEMS